MKKNLIFPVLALMTIVQIYGQSAAATEYMKSIVDEYANVSDASWDYTKAVAHSNSSRKISKKRKDLISTIDKTKAKVSKLPGYEGNTAFRDAVVNFLTVDKELMTNDYVKIEKMEETAQETFEKMEAYINAKLAANRKLQKASSTVQNEQKIFAADHKIPLGPGNEDRAEKIAITNTVYDHYNELFLIFFQSNKAEAFALEALQNQDVDTFEKKVNEMESAVSEDLTKLNKVKPVLNDKSLLDATKRALIFYDQEANAMFPKLLNYYKKKDTFESVKKNFDKIKEKKRTQSDIDRYNNSLQEYQNAANEFNETNEYLNKKRKEAVDNWNTTATKFKDKHVPRGK